MDLNTNYIENSNQDISERFSKEWYKNQSEEDRKLFESILIAFVGLLVLLIYTLTKTPGESGFLKIHSALFIGCVFVFLMLIIRRSDLGVILKNSWKTVTQFKAVNLTELTDTVFFSSAFIAVFTVLFVIDLSFLSSYGIRIGAVIAVGLLKVLKSVFLSFK